MTEESTELAFAPEAGLMFTSEVGQKFQAYLGNRLLESKTGETADAIQKAMGELCAEVMMYLQGWVAVGKRAALGEGCVLYWVERFWPDLEPLHGQYESFNDFAVQETREEYATYRAKMGVYKTFILNEAGDSKIAEEGPDVFLDVPIGKLQKALGAVHRGTMTEDGWDGLLDPNVSDRHFHHIMKSQAAGKSSEDDDFVAQGGEARTTVNMDNGNVTYWPGGSQMGLKVGWLDIDSKQDLIREAVDAIIAAAALKRLS